MKIVSQQTKITHSTASDMKKTYYSGFKNRFIQIYFQKCYLVYRRLYHMLFLGVYQIKVFDIFSELVGGILVNLPRKASCMAWKKFFNSLKSSTYRNTYSTLIIYLWVRFNQLMQTLQESKNNGMVSRCVE